MTSSIFHPFYLSMSTETAETLESSYSLPEHCPMCAALGECAISHLSLPHFPVTLLFAYHCQHCGYRHNEVVNGGGISAFGKRLILRVEAPEDLDRQVVMMRSSGAGGGGTGTADVIIPELNMRVGSGGGCTSEPSAADLEAVEDADVEISDEMASAHAGDLSFTLPNYFTTVQGVLQKILGNLWSTYKSSQRADSPVENIEGLKNAIVKLRQMTRGERLPFTFILEDPLAGVSIDGRGEKLADPFIEATAPFAVNVDKQLVVEAYQRSQAEDEEFGIADMQTENYGEVDVAADERENGPEKAEEGAAEGQSTH